MYGLARGIATLIGAAAAGVLLWFSVQIAETTTPGYWAFVGLIAAAGLVLALSQVIGGWTKWGPPRISVGVLLLGFLPALLVGGWFLLASQPGGSWLQPTAESWAAQAGLAGTFESLAAILPAVAFALGLLFGLIFDTTGPRVDEAEPVRRERDAAPARAERERVEDEPVAAERSTATDDEERIEEEYREPDRDFVRSLSGDERTTRPPEAERR
jgi:hypothetical protein